MSRETIEHLNINTLIGHTASRGTAWHYRAEAQGTESNHYTGAVPVADVQRRLFGWVAESRPVAVQVPACSGTHSEFRGCEWEVIPGKQAITRSDNNAVMGIFDAGYERHQYDEWLLSSVANILDEDLSISSAGLLKRGAIAWVEVSVPEAVETPEGVAFRPNLLATTSFDGSIATTFKRTVTATVCDNTRDLALSEAGAQVKVKHSKNSRLKLMEARDALEIIHTTSDAFAAEVAALCRIEVSDKEWAKFVDRLVPLTIDNSQLAGRALTMASNKRESLESLYGGDSRVAPWAGTAYGVVQAVNTYEHHERIVRGADRAERNMLRTVSGDFSRLDRESWTTLDSVLTR